MKILHTADWHIGLQKDGIIDTDTGISSRILETFKAIEFLIDTAIKEKVDLVIVAGDIFNVSNPHILYEKFVIEQFLKLEEAKIPTKVILGNHDISKTDIRKHSLMSLSSFPWEFVDIITSPKKEKIGERLFIFFPYGNIDPSLVDPSGIIVGHFTVAGARAGAEQLLVPIIENPLRKFKNTFFYLLGHIHQSQFISNVIYPGSLIRISLGERADKKGFYIIEDFKNFRFIEIPFIFSYKLLEFDRIPTEKDFESLTKNDIVRLRITTKIGDKKLYNSLVSQLLNKVHNFDIEILYEKDSLRGASLSSGLSPKQAFSEYLELHKDEIKFFEEVKEKGLEFLSEVLDEN